MFYNHVLRCGSALLRSSIWNDTDRDVRTLHTRLEECNNDLQAQYALSYYYIE